MKGPARGWRRIFLAYGLISGAVFVGALLMLVAIDYYNIPVAPMHPSPVIYLLKLAAVIVLVGGGLLFIRHALDNEYKKD